MLRRFLRRAQTPAALSALAVLACASSLIPACGDQVELGVETGAGLEAGPCEVTKCQRQIYACGDCQDNDDDGLTDSQDPDCLGVCDDTEDSYYGGIPGQNNTPCVQDCYFDQDTGPGNDDCFWTHQCDPLSLSPLFPPSGDERCALNEATTITRESENFGCTALRESQSASCNAYCGPLTPNGCDCFGCCDLGAGYVWLGSTIDCRRGEENNDTACRPCTPVLSCLNECEPCEVCVGKDAPNGSCAPRDAGETGQCPPGRQPCGLKGQEPCPSGQYCITGCCAAVPE